jgi:predicted ATPase/class 3 adenylate cyclase/tetratricopeptide (TPR) repeat protein
LHLPWMKAMTNPFVNAWQRLPSGTVTFLFTDIEGSTKLAREFPGAWEAARERHHTILGKAIESNHGYVFQIVGDAFCAAFHTAADALKAAIQAQQDLQNASWDQILIRVRMGIHTGEAELSGQDYRGYLTMSLIQRLMSAGHGGQILVSDATEKLLREKLHEGVSLRDIGEHKFKDVPHLVRVFQVCASGLQSEFPYLRTLDEHPNNLPGQITSFIGRQKELADVKRLLQNAHLLTLIGPGGTGKTRLSIQAASEMLHQYPDGVWFVELAPILDPLLVSRTTAISIGLRDEPQRPVIDMLCDYLREKRMLILLDNCEHLVDACAQMADRILHVASEVRILASSREALGIGGEVTYRVPSLRLPDLSHLPSLESLDQYEAVKLFIDRACSANPSFMVTNENAPFLAQICHRLDGIPLAIELAAAKIRALSLEQIAKRLDDRFRLLTGGSRTALERHQTLRAAIDWSYNLLPSNEQTLFRRLSIFVNGWTLEAAEFVCSNRVVNIEETLELLEHLINKSLVIMEEASERVRYRMLETLRQYANEKLVESGESNILREKHLDYFLNLAEIAEPHLTRPEQLEWMAVLDADYENVRSALEWALNQESAESSLRLAAALGGYWDLREYWLEGTRWLKKALNKPSQPTKSENLVRVKALNQEAILANALDELERMQNSAERSLALASEASDNRDLAVARFLLGWALERQGDYERGAPLMEQSLREFQGIGDIYWESVNYRWLGNRLVINGMISHEEKIDHHLDLARQAGERKNLADALTNKARLLFDFNHLDETKLLADEAKFLFKQIGSNINELGFLFGSMAWLEGDYQNARFVYMEMQERFGLSGEKNFGMMATEMLGCLAFEEGKFNQAQIYFEKSLATAREIKDKAATVWQLAELGNTCFAEGNVKEYQHNYRESFLLAKDVSLIAKRELLLIALDSIHSQEPEVLACLLGAIHNYVSISARPIGPIMKRSYDRVEAHVRSVLEDIKFEAAFTEGQKLSLDEALDLILKIVDEM